MARYVIPPDTRAKELIVGGVLTMDQLYWLIGGIVFGMAYCVLCFKGTGSIGLGIFSWLVCIVSVTPFMFYKKEGLPLLEYLKRKREYLKKTHRLINEHRVKEV